MLLGREQIEYYLSAVNLDRDTFMRNKMEEDEKGFIDVGVFLACNRIKQIGISSDDLLVACSHSHFLEVRGTRIRPKTPYQKDARRRQKMVRISGFSPSETVDSVFDAVANTTLEPHNIMLQYTQNDSGERVFTGTAHVLYHTEASADAAIATPLYCGDKKMTIERLSDYDQRTRQAGRARPAGIPNRNPK
jgi:lupus La protein